MNPNSPTINDKAYTLAYGGSPTPNAPTLNDLQYFGVQGGASTTGVNNTPLTADTTLTTNSKQVQDVDCTSAARNITPPQTTTAGILFTITKIDSSVNVVNLIGQFNMQTNPTLPTQGKYMTFTTTNVVGKFRIVGNN